MNYTLKQVQESVNYCIYQEMADEINKALSQMIQECAYESIKKQLMLQQQEKV